MPRHVSIGSAQTQNTSFPHWAIPVLYTISTPPSIGRFRRKYILNTHPRLAIPVHHISYPRPLIYRFPPLGDSGSSYI